MLSIFQVKNIGFTGVFRLIFKPLVEEFPGFGAVCYSLRQKVWYISQNSFISHLFYCTKMKISKDLSFFLSYNGAKVLYCEADAHM